MATPYIVIGDDASDHRTVKDGNGQVSIYRVAHIDSITRVFD